MTAGPFRAAYDGAHAACPARTAATCVKGIPMYGVSGLFVDPNDVGTHGLNEHIGVRELHDGREFLYRLVRRLAQ